MSPDEKNLLHHQLNVLEKATQMLVHSYEMCRKVGDKPAYSMTELDQFEALTGRFARMSDMIIRKLFRLIDRLDVEPEGTVRDSINRAEKKGLIDNADHFGKIREIRNIVAHEYLLEDMSQLYRDVLASTPVLIDVVGRIKNYAKRY